MKNMMNERTTNAPQMRSVFAMEGRSTSVMPLAPFESSAGYFMPAPRVYNKHPGDAPPCAKYIGRGSPFGNRFIIGEDGDRDKVCQKFECEPLPDMDVSSLAGCDLVCFCAPHRCHGDSILLKANFRVVVFGCRD
jgi:Domain of unknown function (DUF4326)